MKANLWKVARWEFTQNLKSKPFLILTVVIPIIIVVIGFVPNFLAFQGDEKPVTLYVIDNAGIYDELEKSVEALEGADLNLKLAEEGEAELKTRAEEKEVDGYFVLERPLSSYRQNPVKIYSNLDNKEPLTRAGTALSQVMTRLVGARSLSESGYDPAEIFSKTRPIGFTPVKLEEEDNGIGQFVLPFGIAMMIVLSSMFQGSMVMIGIGKEKSNRIVEIVLSSIDSFDMIAGKLLGFAGLGLAQITLWGGVGLVVLTQIMDIPLSGVTPFQGFYYFCYFVFGYLMIASIYALLGASAKDIQSSSQTRGIFVLIPIIPIYFSAAIVNSPEALWVRLVSFFPPFTPTMMLLRSAFAEVPVWEILTSILVLAGFTYLMVRAATKVFRVGMLMYGKDMSLVEIIKWVRA
ncbi:ABC transporter permease [Candidatus Bipolaricaulota bacterium]|nr:ABC transporter permease [Candidatus Bipolaricaulota bacterium]